MLEAYHQAVELAFTEEIIQKGWEKSGIWPLNPSTVLDDPDLFPPIPIPSPKTPPSTLETVEKGLGTPQNSRDLRRQLRELQRKYPGLPRDVISVLRKTAKTIDILTVENATTRRDNFVLDARINSEREDKRQTVEQDPNQVFASITEIRPAQDKLNKRLREFSTQEQVPIDSFLKMTPRTRKRARKS